MDYISGTKITDIKTLKEKNIDTVDKWNFLKNNSTKSLEDVSNKYDEGQKEIDQKKKELSELQITNENLLKQKNSILSSGAACDIFGTLHQTLLDFEKNYITPLTSETGDDLKNHVNETLKYMNGFTLSTEEDKKFSVKPFNSKGINPLFIGPHLFLPSELVLKSLKRTALDFSYYTSVTTDDNDNTITATVWSYKNGHDLNQSVEIDDNSTDITFPGTKNRPDGSMLILINNEKVKDPFSKRANDNASEGAQVNASRLGNASVKYGSWEVKVPDTIYATFAALQTSSSLLQEGDFKAIQGYLNATVNKVLTDLVTIQNEIEKLSTN